MKSEITFVNHASVLVDCEDIAILSDPWYSGGAFHKGWNLLFENDNADIVKILDRTTHIWISHEHPDHFSIKFFKDFRQHLAERDIEILFQNTVDKRVVSFLRGIGLKYRELEFNLRTMLADQVTVMCIKDGFYDSGLLIENREEKILNLNDCEINTQARALEVKRLTGEVDVLLTQFSFAAWKGGRSNLKWRTDAAKEKIESVRLQAKVFNPKFVIPFASYIKFSNEKNFYLNDAANTPKNLISNCSDGCFEICVMKPLDKFSGFWTLQSTQHAIDFWEMCYDNTDTHLHTYELVTPEDLTILFSDYCKRIKRKNNIKFIRFMRFITPIAIFRSIEIFLSDINQAVTFDYVTQKIEFHQPRGPLLEMKSESLAFIFKNSFGFDTLTVNGCFEEMRNGGFVTATRTLAIENLNNLGFQIRFKILLQFRLYILFMRRLYRVAKKLEE